MIYGILAPDEESLDDLLASEELDVILRARHAPAAYIRDDRVLAALQDRHPNYEIFVAKSYDLPEHGDDS